MLSKIPAVPKSRFRISNRKNPGTMVGCYFLLLNNEVVYIGKSIDIIQRIAQHATDGKEFDEYTYVLCSVEDLNALEARLIVHYSPRYNKAYLSSKLRQHPGPTKHAFLRTTAAPETEATEQPPRMPGKKMRVREAAAYMGMSKSSLDKFRCFGSGPPYFQVGRAVIYDTAEIDEWLSLRRRKSSWGHAPGIVEHSNNLIDA